MAFARSRLEIEKQVVPEDAFTPPPSTCAAASLSACDERELDVFQVFAGESQWALTARLELVLPRVDAEVTIESGGVTFTKKSVPGRHRYDAPVEQLWSDVTGGSFAEVCGDVSSSPDWLVVLDGRESGGELCVGMVEVILDGMPSRWPGWKLE